MLDDKMYDSIIEKKSFEFSVRIYDLHKYLTKEKQEYILSNQILRSGTSIGANIAEGERGQSKADFYAKMSIALKEANETDYWLRLLGATNCLTSNQLSSLQKDLSEIIALLMSICKSTQANLSRTNDL